MPSQQTTSDAATAEQRVLTLNQRLGGRLRATWAAAHTPVPGVPRWARFAAYAVTFTVLPSSLWRIAVCTFHAPISRNGLDVVAAPSGLGDLPLGVYVILLSLASELLAFTAVGLVASWGEVFPRWLPVLRGRPVPPIAAVIPAGLGAAALTLLCTWTAVTIYLGLRVDLSPQTNQSPVGVHDWQGLLATVAYAPLLLWGPLLAALAVSYWKRRRHRRETGSDPMRFGGTGAGVSVPVRRG